MSSKLVAMLLIHMYLMMTTLPLIQVCAIWGTPLPPQCSSSYLPHPSPKPLTPGAGTSKGSPPVSNPPVVRPPPIIKPPIVVPPPNPNPNPPVSKPSPPRAAGNPTSPSGGGGHVEPKCPIYASKLGLCVDALRGFLHAGLANPVEDVCCSVLKGLLDVEAAVCLCAAIRLKLLNISVYLPLALQALVSCGFTPPPGFVCPHDLT